jgi:hydrogenase maturation protease
MSAAAAPAVAIIGCGNPTRGDDGVGPDIVRRLAAGALGRMDPAVRLYDAGTDGLAVLFAARGCHSLIIIDACRSGAEPGAVFEVPAHQFETPAPPVLGTHELRWTHALAAGRSILGDGFPAEATVFLIESENLAFGIELSTAVAAAAACVAARIEALVLAGVTAAFP